MDRNAIEAALAKTLGHAEDMMGGEEAPERHPDFQVVNTSGTYGTRRTRIIDQGEAALPKANPKAGTTAHAAAHTGPIHTAADSRITDCNGNTAVLARVLYLSGTTTHMPSELFHWLLEDGIEAVLNSLWVTLERERGLVRAKPAPQGALELRLAREAARKVEHPDHPDMDAEGFVGGCPACWLAYGVKMGWVK